MALAEYNVAFHEINQISLENPLNFTKQRDLLQKTALKLTILPPFWIWWTRCEGLRQFSDFNLKKLRIRRNKIESQALSCFYQEDIIFVRNKMLENFHFLCSAIQQSRGLVCSDFYYFVSSTERIKKVLSFPHKHHKFLLNECEMMSLQPISPKIIEKYNIASQFYETNKNQHIRKYSYALSDINFAIENIEWNLGKQPTSINLWKFYIKFLKSKNLFLELLNVYSRYCRLFTIDLDVRKEYLDEIKKLDNSDSGMDVTKWWIDYIGIEKHFGSIKIASELIEFVKSKKSNGSWNPRLTKFIENLSLSKVDIARTSFLNVKIEYSKKTIKPNSKNITLTEFKKYYKSQNQIYSLPSPLMTYIYKTASIDFKFILIQTCKNLFYRTKQIFCHNLIISKECKTKPTFYQRSLCTNPKKFIDGINFKNYYITNTLNITINPKLYESQKKIFRKIIKIKKVNEIKHIKLGCQKLTLKELNFLPCNQIKTADLIFVKIQDYNKNYLAVEDLICLFPNATTKRIATAKYFNENSSKNFEEIQLPVKLHHLGLSQIPESFDSNDFVNFLKANVEEDGQLCLKFHATAENIFKRVFETHIRTSFPMMTVFIK